MNILLINPPYRYTKEITSGEVNPSLALMYLSSYCKKQGFKVTIIDSVLEKPNQITQLEDIYYRGLTFKQISDRTKKIREKGKIDAIGITNLFSSSYPVVKELVYFLKQEHDIPIVLGGANASAISEYVLRTSKADFVIISEGEQSFVELCNALKNKDRYKKFKEIDGLAYKEDGKIYVNKKTKFIQNLDELPFPDRDTIQPKEYSKHKEAHGGTKYLWTSILSSRGCPFKCSFCTSPLWNRMFRARSAKNVVDEIEHCVKNYDIKEFLFEDENLTMQKQRILDICNGIIKRNLDIIWQPANGIRASVTDKEVLKKMKEAGCYYIVVAPESGSNRVLKEIINKEQDLDKVTRVVKDALSLKMKTCAYFVIGFPGETKEDVRKTIQYACNLARIGLHECVFSPFIPLPGSPLFYELLEKKELSLNDEFFKKLLASGDILSKQKCWSNYISDNDLKKLKTRGYLMFHLNRAIFHPFGVLKSLINALTGHHELKTEQSLSMLIKRYFKRKE